tara:strand:+ start:1443 stop:1772 length:330 start_codon:yes stop_codon:yes gene_type:complete
MSDATYTVYCDGSSECICINIEFPAQERTTVGAEIWLRSRETAEDLLQQIKEATVASDKAEYTYVSVGSSGAVSVEMEPTKWQHLSYLLQDAIANVYDGCSLPIMERRA